jgi:hypothetical protein
MHRLFTLLALCCCLGEVFAACNGSTPTWTSTPDRVSVASCVASAGRNDTINVSAGSATWASAVNLTKGVTLTGAGVGNTVITSSSGAVLLSGNPDATSIANSDNIKITGFTFDGANSTCTLMTLEGESGITGTKPYRYYVIGNNKFQNGCTSGNGIIEMPANGNGQLRGVIYGNTFDRCNIIIRPFSNNDTGEWANTHFNVFSDGVEDNLYFENNTIQFSSSFAGDNPGWVESGQGGRIVARFNTWNLANATTPQEVWDIHGFQNWNGVVNSGQTGTMLVEYYRNTLSNMGTYRWINHRGSWGMFFNNTLTGSGANAIEINQYALGDAGGSGCAADINPTPSNYTPQVNNTYVFNNSINGTITAMVPGSPIGNGCGTAENLSFWNYQSSFNGTVGVGSGLLSGRPSTCTTGVGYWATDQGSWNSSGAGGQGVLYKCTATNTWTLYYTPYTYPHPLTQVSVSDLTVFVLDAGATSLTINNTGTQGGSQTVSCSAASNQKCKMWFSAPAPNYLKEPGSESACASPCSISLNTERGKYWAKFEITDNTGTSFTPKKLSSPFTIAITPQPALTAPFTIPFAVHGFTDYTKTFQFSLGAVSVSNLRLVAWVFNIRQKELSVLFNGGAEHNVATTQISGFSTDGVSTCTATTPVPHNLVSGPVWMNGFQDFLAQTDSNKRYNGLNTATVTSTTTFTIPCNLAKLDGGATGDWNPNPQTGLPQAGGQFGKTVSATTYYIDERSWFDGLDGVHDDFEIAVPINSGEIVASATNTISFRNKGNQKDGHHGPYIKRFNIVQPDVACTQFVVSGTNATATCVAHGYSDGDTIWFRNAPRERWAFNGMRVIASHTTDTITFPWGPDQGGTPNVAPFLLVNGTYTVPTSNDTIVAPQPQAWVARCLIPKSSFVFYDPANNPSYGGNSTTGSTLWHTATLKDSNDYLPTHATLAHCADCHMKDGFDLKYLGFHPDTIIEAAIRRGLTEQNGKDIAAYIASLSVTTPPNGRPWAKLYQPCPGTDSAAIANWMAGCNDDWDLAYDQDSRPYYCTGGTPPTYTGCSYSQWAATAGGINTHEVPTILPFWHWMRFLPIIHPKDSVNLVFGQDFTLNTAWTLYQQYLSTMVVNTFSSFSTNGLLYIPPNGLLTALSILDGNFISMSVGGQAGNYYPSEFLKMQTSAINWGVSRIIEISNVFQSQNFGDQAWNFWSTLSPNARAAAQYTRLSLWGGYLFSDAPHKSCGGCQYGYLTFGDGRTGAQWNRDTDLTYKQQSVVDAGDRWQTGNFPSDMPYKYGFANTTSNRRPSMYNHIDPMAWETANEMGWNNLVNGGNNQTQSSTNGRFPLAFKGTDAFTSETEKAELVDQVIKQMVYVTTIYTTGDWQAYITNVEGAGCLTHVPGASAFNGSTIVSTVCRSDGLAFAIALSNYFGLNSTDRSTLITWGNTVFASSGYNFNNAASKVCSYDGNHPKSINCI